MPQLRRWISLDLKVIPVKMLSGQLKKLIKLELSKGVLAKGRDLEVIST